ncbi:MAG: ribonuclease P protein component [Candidatus Kerfeldbacteria bacterium]|nr:ribonuclease P protein component [Candidatus Kerfeldbacteria bacterium]
MLPRQQRLRLSADIQAVYARGMKSYHPLFRLLALPTKLAQSRATVVVSKRVDKRAAVRNQVKRRLRALLLRRLKTLSQPHDVVLLVQPKAAKATAAELGQVLDTLLNKLRLL